MSETIRPFDTIITRDKLVFCAEEKGNNDVKGHISYLPHPDGAKRSADGTLFQKNVFEGQKREADRISLLTDNQADIVRSMISIDPMTGERTLRVKTDQILNHIPSGDALNEILHGNAPLPQAYVDAIGTAVNILTDNTGIPAEALGIYGGFAQGIYSDVIPPITDVDLTIHGERYVDNIRIFAGNNRPQIYHGHNPTKRDEWLNRGFQAQQSAIRISQRTAHPTGVPYYLDTWIVRNDTDKIPWFPCIENSDQVQRRTVNIEIAYDQQSLALPAYYGARVKDGSNSYAHIIAPRFHYLASMLRGQHISMTALEIEAGMNQDKFYLLSDPENDRIEYTG